MIYDLEMNDVVENSSYWYVSENILANQKVLDVGCATGYLGTYLKKNFSVDLVGIDNQDFHLKKAAERNVYSDIIKIDLNCLDDELNDYVSYFDRIIICDVLEHLNKPMEILNNLKRFLKDDGKFLIDIPNISHASIKYNLLLNKFDYTPWGLLDDTHVRFFTRDSIINELSRNNFLIEKMEFVFLGPGQFHDQPVNYNKYSQEIVDFIENDFDSSIYQIFVVFEKAEMNPEYLIEHNMTFKELNEDLFHKKEKYAPNDANNPLKYIENNLKEKDETIFSLEQNLIKKNKAISQFETDLQNEKNTVKNLKKLNNEIKSSRSWRMTKSIRYFGFLLKRLKNR